MYKSTVTPSLLICSPATSALFTLARNSCLVLMEQTDSSARCSKERAKTDLKTQVPALLHQFFNKAAGHIGRHSRIAMHEGAFVQDRLCRMQRRHVGTLKESPDGNFFSPEQ